MIFSLQMLALAGALYCAFRAGFVRGQAAALSRYRVRIDEIAKRLDQEEKRRL